jgi:hypothetical protein
MKKKMTQEQFDWNIKFLKEEWNYCIELINEKKKELDNFTIEQHKGLSEQHDFMGIVRHTLGKGWYFYNKDKTNKEHKEILDSSFSIVHRILDVMEQN